MITRSTSIPHQSAEQISVRCKKIFIAIRTWFKKDKQLVQILNWKRLKPSGKPHKNNDIKTLVTGKISNWSYEAYPHESFIKERSYLQYFTLWSVTHVLLYCPSYTTQWNKLISDCTRGQIAGDCNIGVNVL